MRDNTYSRVRSIKKQKRNTKAAEEPDDEETESEGDIYKPRKCDNKVNISTAGLSPGRRMQVEVMNTIGNQIGNTAARVAYLAAAAHSQQLFSLAQSPKIASPSQEK